MKRDLEVTPEIEVSSDDDGDFVIDIIETGGLYVDESRIIDCILLEWILEFDLL